jgi:hypothetical protein
MLAERQRAAKRQPDRRRFSSQDRGVFREIGEAKFGEICEMAGLFGGLAKFGVVFWREFPEEGPAGCRRSKWSGREVAAYVLGRCK